jgi:pyrimidine-specific ribonucleoside hydrolase
MNAGSLLVVFTVLILFSTNTSAQVRPVSVILDTDIGPDYDDVGAMALLHAFADSGKAKILATVSCNQSKYSVGVLSVLNNYFGKPGIPIGVVQGNRAVNLVAWQKWDSVLVSRYPARIKSNSLAEDAVSLYRRILAAQPDNSVTVISTGFFSNLNDLLRSGADKYSSLNGADLVRKKVLRLVSMAGRFPKGGEFNIQCDPISARYVAQNWPTEIIFSGWEIGDPIRTGLPLIHNNAIVRSPVKEAFSIAIPMAAQDSLGRMSWDETAVLAGINGYAPYFTLVEGRMNIEPSGWNSWDSTGKGHFYLKQQLTVADMEKILNSLIMHQPVK